MLRSGLERRRAWSRDPPLAQRRQGRGRRLKVPYALQALARYSRRLKGTGRPAGRLGEGPRPELWGLSGCQYLPQSACFTSWESSCAVAHARCARHGRLSPLAPPCMRTGPRVSVGVDCHLILANLTSPCQS